MVRKFVIVATASLLISPTMAVAQAAQQAPQTQQPGAQANESANDIVCQKIEVTGSRIATKRVCMTRAQWAEQERADQQEIEHIQTQRGCTKNGC